MLRVGKNGVAENVGFLSTSRCPVQPWLPPLFFSLSLISNNDCLILTGNKTSRKKKKQRWPIHGLFPFFFFFVYPWLVPFVSSKLH